MNMRRLRQFLASDRGVVVSTEKILILTLVFMAAVVGVWSLRDALANYLLDEVDAMAACTNLIVFDPGEVEIMTTDDFDILFPDLATEVDRPVPVQAVKESQ